MFTHLHVHTEYSLLDGSAKIPELVRHAKELHMDSLAITDHGNMYGVIDFYQACKNEGIKPIIGCEVYVAPESRFDKEVEKGENKYFHLVLLAENNIGYHNLMKIVSAGFLEGYYYKPRVDKEVLARYHEGMIACSACMAGEVSRYLTRGFYEEAKKAALSYYDIFGKEHFYLEMQDHGIAEQATVNQGLMRIHEETGIPMVVTNDSHYIQAQDAEAHDILLCIQTKAKVADKERMRYDGGQYYLKSEDEMRTLFAYAQEAVDNTHKIAERCNVEIAFGEQKLPRFDVPDGKDSYVYLRQLCETGFAMRYGENQQGIDYDAYYARLDYELTTIKNLGFVDYFLVVWDFIRYAREQGIAVGPGRGSAAGSIVAYCLEITNVDPMSNELIFERFLNPERLTMPDIDVDFADERRQEVIDYVVDKYGKDKVAQIVTFNTLAARQVIRDVGRALDLSYGEVDAVVKMIPSGKDVTIRSTLARVSELQTLYDTNPNIRYLLDMSMQLEGLPRHASVHAAGVVICSVPIADCVPLARGSNAEPITQYNKTLVEELGLMKMDFLAIRTLTVIQNAVSMAVRNHGEDIDIDHISFDDQKVFELLATGQTEGIFQLESAGMRNFMRELKPKNIDEITAGIALYRPGPMEFIPLYRKNRENPSQIVYETPELKEVLSSTYGCIVYQEQVMQIVIQLAGFSMGRSDLVRKAMSKKDMKAMEAERKNFVYGNAELSIDGCVNRGISEEIANHIYDEMVSFGEYAFNKSHAAVYSVVAYQTAWLKCYYPQEFMAAQMTSVLNQTTKLSHYIYHCRQQLGISILPPDVNDGVRDFAAVDGKIRYGLTAIKGLGHAVVDAILLERKKRGVFRDFYDFVERLSSKEVNKRTLEALIKAGALDSLGATRKQMMQVYTKVLDSVAQDKKKRITGQMSLFDMMGAEETGMRVTMPNCGEYDNDVKLAFEKEVLGIYVSGHPLEQYVDNLAKNTTASTADFVADEDGKCNVKDGKSYVIGGIVSEVAMKTTRRGDKMAIIVLEDMIASVEVVLFPKQYELHKQYLTEDRKVYIKGKAQIGSYSSRTGEDGEEEQVEVKLIADRVIPFEDAPKKLWLQFDTPEHYQEEETWLKETLSVYRDEYRSAVPVIVYIKSTKQRIYLPREYHVKREQEVIDLLVWRYGEVNVKVTESGIENLR